MRIKVNEYLVNRKVLDRIYKDFLLDYVEKDACYKSFYIKGYEFAVSKFFDCSSIVGSGIMPTNLVLKTEDSDKIAIGLVEGDDVICMDAKTNEITLWMIQTGDGEHIHVADDFTSFLEIIKRE